VDGQGNFGSVDGDAGGGLSLYECRLDKIASEMLSTIDKETGFDFHAELRLARRGASPAVPADALPNLLVNGILGHRRGMATNIPPPQLGEVSMPCLHVLAQPHCAIEEVIKLMPRTHGSRPPASFYGLAACTRATAAPRARSDSARARTSRRSAEATARRSSSTSCPTSGEQEGRCSSASPSW